MAESKTPLVDEFEEWHKSNYDGEDTYIKDMYLSKYDGCLSDKWMGEDILLDIRSKFARPINYIIDRLEEQKIIDKWAVPIIDASYEDSTHFAIIYEGKVLCHDYYKAWGLQNMTREELDNFLNGIWFACLKALGVEVQEAVGC